MSVMVRGNMFCLATNGQFETKIVTVLGPGLELATAFK
jgi:hypothetical protein